jgi:hypothetical protein
LKSQDIHLISTAGEFASRRNNFRLENSLALYSALKNALPLGMATKFGARRRRKTMKKLKIAWRLCFSRKPFRDLVPECEPRDPGVNLEAY